MRRYLLALLAFTAGCKSVPELAGEGRWIDACERAWKHGDSERDQLFALQAAALDTEVSLRVYDIDALGALLPYVPAQMASGEVVLVEFSLRGSPAAASRLDVAPALYSGSERWSTHRCCDEQGWLVLDGREDEWLQLQAARLKATRERQERLARRRRFPLGGRLAIFRMLGGVLAASLADVLWLGTLGQADLDLRGKIPGAHLSVGGMTRDIVDAAGAVVDGIEADADGPQLDDLGRRKLQTAVALGALTESRRTCSVDSEATTCTSTWLARSHPAPDHLELLVSLMWDETDKHGDFQICDVGSEQRARLPAAPTDIARANGFRSWTPLRDVLRHAD